MAPANDLARGSIRAHLLRLTVPMFLGISAMIIASMVDVVYIGWLGTDELAAISFTFPVVMALSSVSMGIGIGASSIIARVVGSGDPDRVRQLASDALLLTLLLVAIITVIGLVASAPLFRVLGADAKIQPLVEQYMSVWFFGLPLFALPMVATTIMRAVGNAKVPGIIMISGAVLQVIIAPVLIFGLGDWIPGLGLPGAAWAFVLSRLVTLIYTVYALFKLRLLQKPSSRLVELMRSWGEVMRIGVPSMMTNLIGPVSLGITVAILADHSNAVVAGFGVASRIESLATMFLMALSASVGPLVGQNWGAGAHERIVETQQVSYRVCWLYGLGAAALLSLLGRFIVGAIVSDEQVLNAATWYLWLVPISYGLFGISMVVGSSFTALGKPMPALVLSLLRMVAIYIPLAFAGDYLLGYRGVYAAAGLANVLIGVLALLWLRKVMAKEMTTATASANVE
jgi:putative MATE family efflux protein